MKKRRKRRKHFAYGARDSGSVLTEPARQTDLHRAARIEAGIRSQPRSSSEILFARMTIRRGYAGRARRTKVRIPFAGDAQEW